MRRNVVALPADISLQALTALLKEEGHRHRLYPVVDVGGGLVGVVRRRRLQAVVPQDGGDGRSLAEVVERAAVVAYPDEPLRVIAYRMAETGMTRLPVVERTAPRRLVGIIGLTDLLQARVRNLEAERRRERVLPLRLVPPWTRRGRRRAVREGSG